MTEDTLDHKRTFQVGEITYGVRMPTVDEIKGANEIRARTFNEALSRGDLLRDQLEGELRKRKLWNDEREQQYQTLRQEVLEGDFKLQKGGIRLSQAKAVALEMSQKRSEMIELLSSRTELDSNTCEGKADAARFNFLFASCLVYNDTEKSYFPNKLDDYIKKADDPIALKGATEFYYLISGNESVDGQLPENQFLHKFKFVDDKFRLIDKEGRLVNEDGHHIDEYGNLIQWNRDDTSTKVDITGRPVNEKGDFDILHTAFLDDGGKPIDESVYAIDKDKEVDKEAEITETTETTSVKTKPRRSTKKKIESDN